MHHAVIMAGGSGTRLWPLSRRSHPKQLLRIFEGKSLLRRSYERLRALLPAEQIYIITGRDYIEPMAAELPELPRENLMGEPCPRDTANAVGLAAHLLALRDPDGTMGIFTADHIIHPIGTFADTVRRGFEAADRHADALITFGITPHSPHTGYGYVHRGPQVDPGVFEVLEFKEKPDLETARRYVESGEYFWNSGMFVWRLAAIVAQIRKHQPQIDAGLREVAAGFHDPARADAVLACFSLLPKISIDFAVMEKADRVLTVEMPCEWLDVGAWPSLAEVFTPDEAGNTRAAPNVMTLDARDNILVSESDHLVAAIGVRDLILIHSDDATLICRKQDAQRIKDLVEHVRNATGEKYM
ncbi:MAG: mannose-1-phosphate guanylyltransferase [Phycisphaerae bacterium]